MAAASAQADEYPVRKAGLWEQKMKVSMAGAGAMPEMVMRQCTDAAFEKEMKGSNVSGGSGQECSKMDIKKTAAGYVIDAVCTSSAGGTTMTVTSRTEVAGDLTSAYTIKSSNTMKQSGQSQGMSTTMTGSAKWLGACPSGWKPGDIEMPGVPRMNARDMMKK
jgi:hypothetical protein